MKRISRGQRICTLGVTVAAFAFGSGCGGRIDEPAEPNGTITEAVTGVYDWLQFDGDARKSGNNTLETQITAANVSSLKKLFTVTLPGGVRADSTVSVLTNVPTSSGMRDLAFLLTAEGRIMALDAQTGATVWSQLNNPQHLSGKDVQSTPAVDPNRMFVYSAGLDGLIHKYNVGNGVEVTGGGWPELLSAKFTLERAAPALTIAAANGTNYLYMGIGGYGDGGDYQGHIVAIDLATGAQKVFNTICSDQTVHFVTGGLPDCTGTNPTQSGVWARSGVVYDLDTNKIYFATGNGLFSPSTHRWADTIIALNPDGSGINGGPIDSYTPSTFAHLQSADLDLGSSAPLILPMVTSKYPHLAAHVGKDSTLRLANLDNLSGKGGPGNVGGELFSKPLPTGGEVQNAMASWVNPADGSVWIYAVAPVNGVAGNHNGISALKVASDANGNPSLTTMWMNAGSGGSSPFVANNVLYWASSNNLRALNPATGAVLWNNTTIGGIHWQEPVVVNGILYIADNSGHLNAFSLGVCSAPGFSLTAVPASQTVTPGSSASYTVTVTPSCGFSDNVNLTVTGAPAGTTATFVPTSITGGSGSSMLTVTTSNPGTPVGTYPLTITASDAGGQGAGPHSAQVTLVVGSTCVVATPSNGWQDTPFASQTATFTAQYDATPSASPTNTVVALSNGAQMNYTGFAVLVRFNPTGDIDARNGGAYAAASVIPYAAGQTYHFRIVTNVASHTYSSFVTPPGGSELTIGNNFAFRSEQATVQSLNYWGVDVNATAAGTTTVCNFGTQ